MHLRYYRLQISEKSRFRGPFHKQHGKQAQTLLQSRRRHLFIDQCEHNSVGKSLF